MVDTTRGSYAFRGVFLGLLLAFSATACAGPTNPSFEELAEIYTGRWRGNINGSEVMLDMQASKDSLGVEFLGTGTAR